MPWLTKKGLKRRKFERKKRRRRRVDVLKEEE